MRRVFHLESGAGREVKINPCLREDRKEDRKDGAPISPAMAAFLETTSEPYLYNNVQLFLYKDTFRLH